MDKCLASYHARDKVHIILCTRYRTFASAGYNIQWKIRKQKKKNMSIIYQTACFFFSLIYFHFIIWASLFYFAQCYCFAIRQSAT